MSRQTLVIGLGQFGMALARALTHQGSEVLAVDFDEAHIQEITPHVADAVLMDAMDEAALASLAPQQRDVCICALGDDSREGSIIVTALLKQLGAPHIIARANDDLHARILSLVGAHEVIHPERSFGQRIAIRVAWRNVLSVMPLGNNLVLTELHAPESFWGRTLAQLKLPTHYSITVSAIRSAQSPHEAVIPDPNKVIEQGDIFMVVSTEHNARNFTELI